MQPFSVPACSVALCIASLLAWKAKRSRSLSRSGTMAGFCVGFLLVATGLRGLVLFVFYQIGSWATKYKHNEKAKLDATATQSQERTASQVLCVSVVATVLSVIHAVYYGEEELIDFTASPMKSHLTCAVLAHHSTCLADTLASELGMLSTKLSKQHRPRLISQPWRRVPPGTNGGVTVQGTLWSILGGAIMGLTTVVMDVFSGLLLKFSQPLIFQTIVYAAICGFLGSLLDSILGATLQRTYWDVERKQVFHGKNYFYGTSSNSNVPSHLQHICGIDLLTNEQVNFVSVAIITFLGGWVIAPLVFF